MGVVNHNRHLHWTLSDTQLQGDLIRVGKEYRRRIPFCVAYHHVDGHLDRLLRWDKLTRVQQENCRMDVLAKSTLLDAMIDDTFASGFFPDENVS